MMDFPVLMDGATWATSITQRLTAMGQQSTQNTRRCLDASRVQKIPPIWGAPMKTTLRRILARTGCLDVPVETLRDDDDLYEAGLSSMEAVRLMLEVEEAFDIHIPAEAISRKLFQSIGSLATELGRLLDEPSHEEVTVHGR
jgi:acyl carrier protein